MIATDTALLQAELHRMKKFANVQRKLALCESINLAANIQSRIAPRQQRPQTRLSVNDAELSRWEHR